MKSAIDIDTLSYDYVAMLGGAQIFMVTRVEGPKQESTEEKLSSERDRTIQLNVQSLPAPTSHLKIPAVVSLSRLSHCHSFVNNSTFNQILTSIINFKEQELLDLNY